MTDATTCTYRKLVAKGSLVHCGLVNIGVPATADPCQQCQSEWVDGIPTREALTPTLTKMVDKFSGKPAERATARPPTMLERMKSFAFAYARHLARGGGVLHPDEAKVRRDICNQCQYIGSTMGAKVCNLCGCSLAIKTKWPEQSCPIKLWPGDADKPPCGSPCGQSNNLAGEGGTTSLATK